MRDLKDLKISKELIKAVLNIPKENIIDVYIDGKYLLIKKDNNRIEEYNIYEFAFKCKEWAYENNYYFYSTPCFAPEAIIKSCECILKSLKNEN